MSKQEFNEIKIDIKEIKNLLNNLNVEIVTQHHDLYGNGKKGIIQRVEDLEENNKNIIKRVSYFSGVFAVIGYFFKEVFNFITQK